MCEAIFLTVNRCQQAIPGGGAGETDAVADSQRQDLQRQGTPAVKANCPETAVSSKTNTPSVVYRGEVEVLLVYGGKGSQCAKCLISHLSQYENCFQLQHLC